IGIPVTTSFAVGGMAVACTAVVAALTLLPALLSIFGTRVNALRIPLLQRTQHLKKTGSVTSVTANTPIVRRGDEQQSGFWYRWAIAVMRRPIAVLVLITALLLELGLPALTLNPGLPSTSALPNQSEARKSLDLLSTAFPGINSDPIYVTVQAQDDSSMLLERRLEQIDTLSQQLQQQRHITALVSLTHLPPMPETATLTQQQLRQLYITGSYQYIPALAQFVAATTNQNTTLITLKANVSSDSSDGETVIDQLRAIAHQTSNGLSVQVGGASASSLDFDRVLYSNFIRTLLFIFIATYILLLCILRSVFLPLKAIVMNILSITASFGALVFIFQQGHLANVLNFTSNGIIDRFVPILMFCTLFGLSMDYEVFLLFRIREEWEATHDNRAAVVRGLQQTGGVITNAAILFAIVSGAFIFTSLIVTKELGLGITVAVLVDATIIRTILVPAGMQVMGRWNWWFPWSGRRNRRTAHISGME
ncbi:MAG: MMPL family transporter, partial [Chloroflexota bacterium]|nr:MMPL family transporter [Chloroflexota bacterium]